jgi:hypothetical protein
MATKKDHQQWLKEWKAHLKSVQKFVTAYEKKIKKMAPGEQVTTLDGIERPTNPPPNP